MHDLHETMVWYREHETARQIGFNPDGMCQKVCRTARDIGPVYPTAKRAQDATPKEHRFHRVADLRKGMVLYFDDPNDANVAGHVVTLIGRVRGFDPDSLHDLLVRTNSVKAGELVVVRGDYFGDHWGDEFQFGSNWVNGNVVDVFTRKPTAPPRATRKDFAESRPNWDVKILRRLGEKVPEIKTVARKIDQAVEDLPNGIKDERVDAFKQAYEKDGVLKMRLLNDVVRDDARATRVKAGRDELRALIKSVLPKA